MIGLGAITTAVGAVGLAPLIGIVLKWTFRLGFIMAGVASFVILLNLGLSMVLVGLNGNILGDLLAIVGQWLPFDITVMISWLMSAVSAYMAYRLAVIAIAFISKLTA